MQDTHARGRRATRPAAPEAPARRLQLFDVRAPLVLSDGSRLWPGETVGIPTAPGERITVARALKASAAPELLAHVGRALAARDVVALASPSARRPRRSRSSVPASPPRLELIRADGARGPVRELGSPAAAGPAVYEATAPLPHLGMLPGDRLVIDGPRASLVRHSLRIDPAQLTVPGLERRQ